MMDRIQTIDANTSQLSGFAEQEAKRVGVTGLSVSISHSDEQAIAVAIASF